MMQRPTTPPSQFLRYDDALPRVVDVVANFMGVTEITNGNIRFLQDAAGVISVVVDQQPAEVTRNLLSTELQALGSYIDPSWAVTTAQESYDDSLANRDIFRRVAVETSNGTVEAFFLDRRIVGFDWLANIAPPIADAPPIISFSSLKGGVGRSTALTIAAQDLSLSGLRVLVIDLDLEAPGLGSMLLPPENRPRYGSLDFFVERGPSAFKDEDFNLLMEPSPLMVNGAPVYVVPAFGSESLKNPSNVLGKLARSYFENLNADGSLDTFLDRTRKLVTGLCQARDFDVILIDSRAGLHETAAASMLGLGADVLLFGVNQSQTFEGYLPLLSHISKMIPNADELLPRIRMVHSKANLNDTAEVEQFLDSSHRMFVDTLYANPEQSPDDFELSFVDWYNVTDTDGPHYPWIIGDSSNHRLFDPISRPVQIDSSSYAEPYGNFLLNVRDNVFSRLGFTNA